MKLLYFIPSLFGPGGMERVLTQKVNYLSNNLGYEISIVTTEQMDNACFYPISEKIDLLHLNIDFNKHYNKGIINKTYSHFKKLKLYRKLVEEIINENKPDLCISLCGKEIEFLSKIKTKVPKVAEIHFSMNYRKQFITSRKKGFIWALLGDIRTLQLKKATKNLDKLVVLTSQDKDQWKKTHRNIIQIPNPNPFDPRSSSKVQNKTVITVGRLDAQKGYDLLIDSWVFVAQKNPDWALNIFGKGEWEDLLLSKIKINKLENRVYLKGLSSQIEKEYESSSIFVMSSRYEGFGMVILEAMSFGLPVVSFNCQWGPSDLIQDGKNGFLVPPLDIKTLADKINYLIEHAIERKEMSINAIESSKKYQISEIMKQWDSLFNSLHKVK